MKLTAFLLLAALPFLEASSPAEAGLVVRAKGKVATPKVDTTKSKEDTTKPKAGTTGTSKYDPLRPNVGCIPATCGSVCRRDFEPRFAAVAALKKRANAPATPASKTATGLDDWTKEVWKSPKMSFDIGGPPPPKAIFGTWEELGDMKFVTMYGLFGCASVVVVSDKGFYMTHHWDNTISDDGLVQEPNMFANAVTRPLKGEGKVNDPAVEIFYPTDRWTALTEDGPKDAFAEENNPKAAVILHDGKDEDGNPTSAQFDKTGPKMIELVRELVPGSNPKPAVYENAERDIHKAANKPPSQSGSEGQQPGGQQTSKQTGKQQGQASDNQGSIKSSSAASTASLNKADRHGKVIISYDKATKIYEVWMAGVDVTEPILTNAKKSA